MALRDTYPLYVANVAEQPNADLVVTDKFTGKPATRVAMADAATIDHGIAAAVAAADAADAAAAAASSSSTAVALGESDVLLAQSSPSAVVRTELSGKKTQTSDSEASANRFNKTKTSPSTMRVFVSE